MYIYICTHTCNTLYWRHRHHLVPEDILVRPPRGAAVEDFRRIIMIVIITILLLPPPLLLLLLLLLLILIMIMIIVICTIVVSMISIIIMQPSRIRVGFDILYAGSIAVWGTLVLERYVMLCKITLCYSTCYYVIV